MTTTAKLKRLALALLICVASGAGITGAIGTAVFALMLVFGLNGANLTALGYALALLGSGLLGLWVADQVEAHL